MTSAIARLRSARYARDIVGIAFIVFFALLYLSPALKDGLNFGPADIGAGLSVLTAGSITTATHNVVNGDIITQGVPWATLNWHLVHAGELPLWNDYSGSGLPQFLNFESGVFSLPSLVSYLFPLSSSFLVSVFTKLVIAGCGTYLFVRLLGGRTAACVLAGTTFMLSGSFSGWLGWAVGAPLAWAGFLAAGVVLAYRSRRRVRHIAFLGTCVAFAIYAGFPETDALLAAGLVVLLLASALATLLSRRTVEARGVGRVALGLGTGVLLATPLWLPGFSIIRHSARYGKNAASGLPLHAVFLAFAQGFDGLPVKGSAYFGPFDYFETSAYVGIIALLFAGLAVLRWWRRPAVFGCAVGALFSLGLVYDLGASAPIQHLVSALGFGAIALQRMLPVLAFFIAVLAGLGLEKFCRDFDDDHTRLALLSLSGLVLVILGVMWSKVSSAAYLPSPPAPANPTTTTASALRQASLYWPTAEACALFLFAGALCFAGPIRKISSKVLSSYATTACCLLQALFLLFAGVGINSYAKVAYPVTPAVAELQSIVGSGLLGLDGANVRCTPNGPQPCGVRQWTGLGFYPEMNIDYGVRELAMHDPTMPNAVFTSWPVADADQTYGGNLNLFAPAITSVSLARRYGVSYVLVAPKRASPPGMRQIATIPTKAGVLGLFAVPGAAQFSFDSKESLARVTSVSHTGDATWHLGLHVVRKERLVLRVTNVPGFHVEANGKALSTSASDGVFLSVLVPAGTTALVLRYWPARLSVSFGVALLTLFGLLMYGLASFVVERSKRRDAAVGRTGNR
jgi:hypothetical protein